MLIIFDGRELEWSGDNVDVSIIGYPFIGSGGLGSGVLCASGWTGSGNYGEWNVSGYAAYSVVVQDSAVTMASQLITVPSRVTWTLQAEEL